MATGGSLVEREVSGVVMAASGSLAERSCSFFVFIFISNTAMITWKFYEMKERNTSFH